MKAIAAIKEYFNPPPVSMSELKELSKEERQELGRLACEQLGVEFEAAEDKG
jgi:hypothetical protein